MARAASRTAGTVMVVARRSVAAGSGNRLGILVDPRIARRSALDSSGPSRDGERDGAGKNSQGELHLAIEYGEAGRRLTRMSAFGQLPPMKPRS